MSFQCSSCKSHNKIIMANNLCIECNNEEKKRVGKQSKLNDKEEY